MSSLTTTDKFSLRWSNFQKNISKTFSSLRSEEEFFDVTLVTDDQGMMSAHKLVLSACSPYFKHVLTQNKHSHPMLCLEGISSSELKYVLDYIYQGEVLLCQEELDRFVNIGSRLQLEGLVAVEDQVLKQERGPSVKSIVTKQTPSTRSTNRVQEPAKQKIVKTESFISPAFQNFTIDLEKNMVLPNDSTHNLQNYLISEVDQKINENFYMNADTSFTCGVCGMTKKRLSDIQTHVELHLHQQIFIPCQVCGKSFKTRSLLSKHLCPVAVA